MRSFVSSPYAGHGALPMRCCGFAAWPIARRKVGGVDAGPGALSGESR